MRLRGSFGIGFKEIVLVCTVFPVIYFIIKTDLISFRMLSSLLVLVNLLVAIRTVLRSRKLVSEIILSVNNSTLRAIINAVTASVLPTNKKVSHASDQTTAQMKIMTAISAVVENRRSSQIISCILLLLALVIYCGFALYTHSEISSTLVFFLVALLTLANAAAVSLNYRVNRGLYGTNEYEAREIIRFVLDHSDDIDFSQGLGARDLDLSPEAEQLGVALWEGVKV